MKKIIYSIICLILFALVFSFAAKTTDGTVCAAEEPAMTREGDTVWMGEYPQTIASDEAVAQMGDAADADGYYVSAYDNGRYAKVVAEPYAYGGDGKFSEETRPQNGATYYFKVEPIEWTVIDEDGDSLKLISAAILDVCAWETDIEGNKTSASCYNVSDGTPENTPACDWQYSEMRAWLNSAFEDKAFDSSERAVIKTTTLVPEDTTSAANTEDKIFLLSNEDFNKTLGSKPASDYCIAEGIQYFSNNYLYSFWWLNDVHNVNDYGYIRAVWGTDDTGCVGVDQTNVGVRPVMWVDASDAEVTLSAEQKEAAMWKGIEIAAIVGICAGAAMAIPFMVVTSKKQKKLAKAAGANARYNMTKTETAMIAVGTALFALGLVGIIVSFGMNGGLSLFAGTPDGVYVQTGSYSGGGVTQEGSTYYQFDDDGTVHYGYCETDGSGMVQWESGTWTQSGNEVTVTMSSYSGTFTINLSGTELSYGGEVVYEKL